MQIHHLNCISTCPLGGKIMDAGQESIFTRGRLTNHCLPGLRLSRFFLTLVSPDFREEMTAIRQIEKLGYDPKDVRHIVLTHLDFDHAGGLDDFPHAHVHMMGAERDYAIQQKTWLDRQRFRPQQWSTQANWKVHDAGEGETWFGFHRVQTLHGLPPEIVMIPLLGHTLGHAGIAVQTEGKWLLLAGDAYFFHQEMHPDAPWCTPGLAFYQRMMEKDHKTRIMNQKRLRELRRSSPEVEIFCSHDVREFEKLSGRSAGIPTEHLVSK